MSNKKKISRLIYVMLLFAFSVAFAVFIFPTEKQFEYSYDKGSQWLYDDLYAPFDFALIRSDEEIVAAEDSIVRDFIPYYSVDSTVALSVTDRYIKAIKKLAYNLKGTNANGVDDNLIGKFLDASKIKLQDIYAKGVIQPSDDNNYVRPDKKIRIVCDNVSELEVIDDFYTDSLVEKEMLSIYRTFTNIYIADSLGGFFLKEQIQNNNFNSNINPDTELNESYMMSRIASVSQMSGMVHKGDLIIAKGEVVGGYSLRALDSYKLQFENTTTKTSFWMVEAGVAIIFIILFVAIFMYMWLFDKKKVWSMRENTFFVSQMLILFLVVYLVFTYSSVSINIVPFVLVPLLLITFMEFHVSFLIYFITILIASFFAANRFEFIFIQLITGLIGMFSLKNTSKRQQIFVSMVVVFITYSLLHAGFSLIRMGTISQHEFHEFLYYGISSALLLLYLPFVFIYEKLFGFISGFTLMELCDTNNPALRELSEKAQGTFQHSVMLSNIVESVVRELGGKPLLARAGALYHDIGKTNSSEYFIENQNGGKNIHDSLTYEESARKIIAHVEEGIAMAKKYKLPSQIIDFIEQHHGTSVTRYFYNSWINEHPSETPDIAKFQYSGPKPQSIELIAMMMSDAVEAASRTLKVYSHESIEKLVNNIIDSQFKDGQYDDVDITMKQIGKAKKVLVSKIEHIYHSRIEYPEVNDQPKQ